MGARACVFTGLKLSFWTALQIYSSIGSYESRRHNTLNLAGSCGRQRRGTALDTGGPIFFFTAFIYLSKFFIVVSYIICSYSLIQFIYY